MEPLSDKLMSAFADSIDLVFSNFENNGLIVSNTNVLLICRVMEFLTLSVGFLSITDQMAVLKLKYVLCTLFFTSCVNIAIFSILHLYF